MTDIENQSSSVSDELLRAVAESSNLLMTAASLESGVLQAMERIAEAISVDRIYIFKNGVAPDSGKLTMSQRYEWCRGGILPQVDNPSLQNQPYDTFPGLSDALDSGQVWGFNVKDLPPTVKSFLEAQQIISILVVPIYIERRWWGFIGFDDCQSTRSWRTSEIDILRTIAGVFGGVVSRGDTLAMLKEREVHSRFSSEKLQTLFDNLSIGIAVISPDLKVMEVNRKMKEWFPDMESRGFAICTHMLCDYRIQKPCSRCPIVQTFADGKVHEYVMENNLIGPQHARVISSPLKNELGEVRGVIELMEDITDRLTLENQMRQAQKMEAIGQLAGGIAHDFNNLLTVILNSNDVARQTTGQDHPTAGLLQDIDAAARRAADLTRRLLAFSRKQPIKTALADFNQIVTDLESMIRRLIGENITVKILVSPEACWAEVDTGQIDQLIMNLVVNSRDAMPDGGTLTIAVEPVHAQQGRLPGTAQRLPEHVDGPRLRLSIADTGTGMTPEQVGHLFKPFYTTKDVGRGTGLGLSVVYGIVSQHLGHITCETAPGEGTRFDIYLPRKGAPAPILSVEAEKPMVPEAPPCHRGVILLVEDEPAVQKIAEHILRDLGFEVILAEDGSHALENMTNQSRPVTLVITDLVMPGMSGVELVDQLRQSHPGLPAILMSGYPDKHLTFEEGNPHPFRFLQKPFRRADLEEKIRETLGPGMPETTPP